MNTKGLKQFDEQTKEQLEKLKLAAEIAKLNYEAKEQTKPFWRKPTFLSLFIPLTVPLISFIAYYYLGGGKEYFDIKSENIKYAQNQIEIKTKRLKDSAAILENLYIKRSTELELLFEDKKALLIKQQDTLKGQIKTLDSHKLKLSKEIQSLKTNLENQALAERLAAIRIDTNGYSNSSNVLELARFLKKNPAKWEKMVLAEIDQNKNPVSQVKELMCLYISTNKIEHIDRIFKIGEDLVRKNGQLNANFIDGFFWSQLAWFPPYQDSVIKMNNEGMIVIIRNIVALIKKYNPSALYQSTILRGAVNLVSKNFNLALYDKSTFLELMQIARDKILDLPEDKFSSSYYSYYTIIRQYSPYLFVCMLCKLIEQNEDVFHETNLFDASNMLKEISFQNSDIGLPSIFTNETLINWRDEHKALYDIWMEPELNTLKSKLEIEINDIGKNWYNW